MRVLIACEESQVICTAFREMGHETYSNDLIKCSGGHPEWHLQIDVIEALKQHWDLIIAHPPCTFLTVSNTYIKRGCKKYTPQQAVKFRESAILFFMSLVNAECNKIAIENPVGIMSTVYKKPDQIIQPWYFGDNESKKTCLWLKGLPLLKETNRLPGDFKTRRNNQTPSGQNKLGPSPERSKLRSKTYGGIAKAMAEQWG